MAIDTIGPYPVQPIRDFLAGFHAGPEVYRGCRLRHAYLRYPQLVFRARATAALSQ